MRVFHSLDSLDVYGDCSVSIGTFDGLHLGHVAVLEEMIRQGRSRELSTFVYTFRNHPAAFLRMEEASTLIMDEREKWAVLESMGVDYLASLPFDERQLALSADEFIYDVILGKIHAKSVTVGHDFRFGHGAKATAEDLKEYGRRLGFEVFVLPPVLYNDRRISSTDIRGFLAEGRVEEAARLLGREYFVLGTVVNGAALGRTMGIPTINFGASRQLVLRKGVYFTHAEFDDRRYPSITNIGFKPTVCDGKELVVETHLLQFHGNLYGKQVKVVFHKWHRAETLFSSREELASAIRSDVESAERFFNLL